ncbi:MAG: hypothetical protein FWC27_01050 [Firmicutes bacterium]|nr:hypothetical protein [Bacillota bacterium]
MPSFWSYITNEKYAIGCTGQTVYVYDASGNELARFKDLTYAYTPMFCPGQNIFVVKSTDGRLAVYSLDEMRLIQKLRYSKTDAGQDDGFCFSRDGKYFYNIERHIPGYNSCLSIYETSGLQRIQQLFLSEPALELDHIECDADSGELFVLGYMRDETGVFDYGFAAALEQERLTRVTKIAFDEYSHIQGYKRLELMGFTQKAKRWSIFHYSGYDMEQLGHVKLSDLICKEESP